MLSTAESRTRVSGGVSAYELAWFRTTPPRAKLSTQCSAAPSVVMSGTFAPPTPEHKWQG